jgi:hypothetical protein
VKKLLEVSGAWSAFEAGTTVEELEAQAAKAEAEAVAAGAEA